MTARLPVQGLYQRFGSFLGALLRAKGDPLVVAGAGGILGRAEVALGLLQPIRGTIHQGSLARAAPRQASCIPRRPGDSTLAELPRLLE